MKYTNSGYITYMYLGNRKTQYAIDNDLGLRQQSISVLLQQAGVHYHVINPRIEEIERYIFNPRGRRDRSRHTASSVAGTSTYCSRVL